jgi:16S rRNA G966 N2-methylase RsmD
MDNGVRIFALQARAGVKPGEVILMTSKKAVEGKASQGGPSSLVDTRVIWCGDNLDILKAMPDGCVDLIYIDPPFNSNRNYEVFWGETKEKRAFEDRHESTHVGGRKRSE